MLSICQKNVQGISLLLICLSFLESSSQNDSSAHLIFSGYGELYYSFDFAKPTNKEKSNFIYNHKRHNELSINLILIKAKYEYKLLRYNVGIMAGNYAQYNLTSEPTWAQYINEANIGLKLSRKHHVWLDAGVMPSHIGFESAISADCWTLTRSILADNSPYYETGIRISFINKKEKLYVAGLLLNGWQKIKTPAYIKLPAYGLQVTYKPKKNLTFNYSNFLGSDLPDSLQSIRHFHNLYAQIETSKNFGIIVGFDIGSEKVLQNGFKTWLSPVIILRQKTSKHTYLALRGEYYDDKHQVLIHTGTTNGFQTFGVSTNFDVAFDHNLWFRIEGKLYHSKDKIFNTQHNNYSLTSNLTIRF